METGTDVNECSLCTAQRNMSVLYKQWALAKVNRIFPEPVHDCQDVTYQTTDHRMHRCRVMCVSLDFVTPR